MTYTATKEATDTKTPIAILIDRNSASAAEIFSGTLQAQKRATIIGEKSFGKGTVQTLFPLGTDEAIKLTISEYLLSNGKSIHGIGIIPDIKIKPKHYSQRKRVKTSQKKIKLILAKLKKGTLKAKAYTPTKHEIQEKPLIIDRAIKKALQVLKNSN